MDCKVGEYACERVLVHLCNTQRETGLLFVKGVQGNGGFGLRPDVASPRNAAVGVVVATRCAAVRPSRTAAAELAVELLLADLVPPAGSLSVD